MHAGSRTVASELAIDISTDLALDHDVPTSGGDGWRRGAIDAVHRADGTITLRDVSAGAELHVRGGRLLPGDGYRETARPVRAELARTGALLRLRARGLYHVHAAAVVAPDGGAIVFAGPSGAGKSTLAYALARRGWPVLGDDGVLLSSGVEVCATAWREPLQVSRALASEFPELAARDALADLGDPRQRIPVSATLARRAPVRALLIPQLGGTDRLTSIGPTEAMSVLVRQSPWVLLADAHASAHLAALQQIVERTPAFRLEHSPRALHAIADVLRALDVAA